MAGKRGNSEGSIRKRLDDDRWEARYVDVEGKRKSIYGKTRQEVVRQLAEAARRREEGLTDLDSRQTLRDYLSTWIAGYKRSRRYGSYLHVESITRRHLIPGLGKIVLARLTPQQVEIFYARKLADGCTPTTVRYCHKVLRGALAEALRLGLVHRNVATLVKPTRVQPREMSVFNEDQVQVLLDAVRGTRMEAFTVTALATGMREGELFALKWADVDLDEAAVLVRANLVFTPQGALFEEAKTKHSRSRIALSQTAIDALCHHRLRQAEERLRLGSAWSDLDLVFPNGLGRPYRANHIRVNWWYPLLLRAGLPRIRIHDLRHTAATLLLARGINPKVVSEMLGHAHIGITLGIYGHVLPHMQQEAASAMDSILQRRRTT